jgi:hypothetical protein
MRYPYLEKKKFLHNIDIIININAGWDEWGQKSRKDQQL